MSGLFEAQVPYAGFTFYWVVLLYLTVLQISGGFIKDKNSFLPCFLCLFFPLSLYWSPLPCMCGKTFQKLHEIISVEVID